MMFLAGLRRLDIFLGRLTLCFVADLRAAWAALNRMAPAARAFTCAAEGFFALVFFLFGFTSLVIFKVVSGVNLWLASETHTRPIE